MRILSYALLIFGFFYICYCQLVVGPLSRVVLHEQYAKLPKQESYSKDDVGHAILFAVRDMKQHVPLFIIGAFMMLRGAMILDYTKRPK
ncbi:MAG: hypothetical protein JWQ71_2207 [Pedosphaera sp.]|nr:hypothetical protein [Pedosphaera sp.]